MLIKVVVLVPSGENFIRTFDGKDKKKALSFARRQAKKPLVPFVGVYSRVDKEPYEVLEKIYNPDFDQTDTSTTALSLLVLGTN